MPRRPHDPTWTDDVLEAMRQLGRPHHLRDIYQRTAEVRVAAGRPLNPTYKRTISRTLQQRCPRCRTQQRGDQLFEMHGNGIWSLA